MASPFNYGANRADKEIEDYEDPPEIVALRRLRQGFIRDIVPSHIIPVLKTCLTRREEEQIRAEEGNKGPITGAMMFLDYLIKKDRWYEQFLSALKDDDVKLEHLALELENEVKVCKEESKRDHARRSMTFGGSYTEGQADAGLQSTNPDLQNCQQSFRSRYVQGAFTVNDVEQAMRDVRINLAANLPGPPDGPPPPYTTGTYFEDGGRLVQSAGGTPQQNKPLTVNQYFVNVNVQKGNVQVGSDNVHIGNDDVTSSAGNGNKQTQDVKTSPSADSKDGRIRNDEEEDEECIIEGEIIEEEEEGNDLMSGFSEEKKVTGPEKNDTETEEATSSDDKAKEETADSSIAGSADDTDGVVNNTKLSEEDQVSNGAAASSSVSSTTPKMGSKMEYEKLELRDYQEELAKPAFDGHNCIICAPTGTGKTHVAMAITKHCFVESLAEQAQSNGGDVTFKRKAIFLVHRIPLLNQTYKRFKRHLPLLNIAKRSGASMTNTGFEMLVPVNDMIITTGGILKNSLTEKKVTLDEFSLIIIDECHHAMKNHPYNVIMAEYLRLKLSNPTTKLPQIIGLTASPGSGSKSGLKTATDHILKLCANMDAHMFVTVKDEKNKESLGKVTNDPDKYTSVTDPRKPDPFKEKVEEIMVEIEKRAGLTAPGQRETQQYETFIMESLNAATSGRQHEVAKCCEHLREYNTALQMNSLCRMADALDVIESFYNERSARGQHRATDIEKWLYKLFKKSSSNLFDISEEEESYPNPKVVKLKSTLKEEIGQKGQDLRGIMFVKTRKLAKAVCECIKDDNELVNLKPAIVTGVQAKSDDSMKQSDQDLALKKFSEGACKLIIATSVAEEGLDIPECHMVIRYNYATNEISMRQSRGRARAQHSTEHFIGDSELAIKDKVNVFLDQQVEQAIQNVQQIPNDRFLNSVAIIQRSVVADRCRQERLQQLQKSANQASSVNLYCKGCNEFVCKGSDVFKYDCNHFIQDKEIVENKIVFKEHTKAEQREVGVMKIFCKNCKQDWGLPSHPHNNFQSLRL